MNQFDQKIVLEFHESGISLLVVENQSSKKLPNIFTEYSEKCWNPTEINFTENIFTENIFTEIYSK